MPILFGNIQIQMSIAVAGHGTVIAGGCSVGDDSFVGMYSILGADVVILHPPIPATTVGLDCVWLSSK